MAMNINAISRMRHETVSCYRHEWLLKEFFYTRYRSSWTWRHVSGYLVPDLLKQSSDLIFKSIIVQTLLGHFDPRSWDRYIVSKRRNQLPSDEASCPRRTDTTATPLRKPKILAQFFHILLLGNHKSKFVHWVIKTQHSTRTPLWRVVLGPTYLKMGRGAEDLYC
jgi:hypothetical protein